ncbi:response regulator [bacterium 0.1xD8-71]|nr:response regulator [bacterium 0.1xD8-71]
MYSILAIYQCFMVLGCIIFVILMMRQRESNLSKLMLCIGFLGAFQNAGYLLELLSQDLGEAMVAVRMEYLGGAFITTFLFVFVARYCGYNVPRLLEALMFGVDGFVLLCVWGYEHTGLYYSSVSFTTDSAIPHLELGRGPFYYIFLVQLIIHLVGCFLFTMQANRRSQKGKMKLNVLTLGICCIFPIIGMVLSLARVIDGFDVVPGFEALGIMGFGIVVIFYHVFDLSISAHEEVIRSIDEAVLILDEDGSFIEANDKAEELFHVLTQFKKGDRVSAESLKDVFADNNNFEYSNRDHSFEVHVNKIWNKRILAGYAIVFMDVTENKKQLQQMQTLKVNAEKANMAKSEFLARMSHEIRTPISAVLGMNEMVLRESKDTEIKKYSMDIKSSAQALLGIINDILDFSKIESGKLEIIPAEYELNSMLNDLFNMFSLRTQEKGLKFDVIVDPKLPSKLYGDDIRIRQVLSNFLSNAVKYTEKGTVTLELAGRTEEDNVILHFTVKDTGIGIKQENMSKLFLAFERFDEEKNRNIEGTGLGMNISAQLLKLMGADLKVESVYGKGSSFSFDLRQRILEEEPIGSFQERARKAAREHVYQASFTAPEGEILLVDDNRVNRKVFCGLLKQTKVKIKDVGSGKECLEEVAKKHYDMIFLDHMMPEMDGMETMSRMKQLQDNQCMDTPVVMLTANAIMGAREHYLAEGFDDFLAKPIVQDKLEKIMVQWMPPEKINSST